MTISNYNTEILIADQQQEIEQLRLKTQQLQLELNNIHIKKYEEIQKNKTVYILSTDIDGIYKIGFTKNTARHRSKDLQTAQVNDIEILYEYKTFDANLVEYVVHNILNKYRCNSNREHFECNLVYAINTIKSVAIFIDTHFSSYDALLYDEFLQKLSNNNFGKLPEPIYGTENVTQNIVLNFVKEICDLKPGNKEFRVSASLLYETFNQWVIYQESNVQKLKSKQFKERISHITKHDYEKRILVPNNSVQVPGWYGIRIKPIGLFPIITGLLISDQLNNSDLSNQIKQR
jgi:hypothetical protein